MNAPVPTLARMIRRRTCELGLTQRQAAALCGAGLRTWRAWAYGEAVPNVSSLAGLARLLGLPVEEVSRLRREQRRAR